MAWPHRTCSDFCRNIQGILCISTFACGSETKVRFAVFFFLSVVTFRRCLWCGELAALRLRVFLVLVSAIWTGTCLSRLVYVRSVALRYLVKIIQESVWFAVLIFIGDDIFFALDNESNNWLGYLILFWWFPCKCKCSGRPRIVHASDVSTTTESSGRKMQDLWESVCAWCALFIFIDVGVINFQQAYLRIIGVVYNCPNVSPESICSDAPNDNVVRKTELRRWIFEREGMINAV